MGDFSELSIVEYEKLYAKYLKEPSDKLLGDVKNKVVLDLCAGTFRTSRRAEELGATRVISHDIDDHFYSYQKGYLNLVTGDLLSPVNLSSLLNKIGRYCIDVVVCRQAINYWFSNEAIETIVRMLKRDGRFTFNTFNECPSAIPKTTQYVINNEMGRPIEYVEVVQLLRETTSDQIFHLQACTGEEPHITYFRWISRETFSLILNKYFLDVQEIIQGKTSIWTAQNIR